MDRVRLVRCVVTNLTFLLIIPAVSPAAAAQPEATPFREVITNRVVGNCDGFDIIENAEIEGRETTYFDRDGKPSRISIHGHYSWTLTNSVTGEFLVDAPDPILAVIDFERETFALKGLHYRITVPGQGIVVLDAGTATFYADGTVVAHGPAPDYEQLPALLCSLLAE